MDPDLRRRALRRYEGGRWRRALPWALPGLILAVAVVQRGFPSLAGIGLVAAVLCVVLRWRGEGWGVGVPYGIVGGLVTAAGPLWVACGTCSTVCTSTCFTVAAVSGGVGVLMLGRGAGDYRVLAGGAMVCSLMGATGCLALGAGGLVGVAVILGFSVPYVVGQRLAQA